MRRLLGDYGMVLVLLGLCALFSVLTIKREAPSGPAAAAQVAGRIAAACGRRDAVLAVGARNKPSAELAREVARRLRAAGRERVRVVVGSPRDLRLALDELTVRGEQLAAVAASGEVLHWPVLLEAERTHPSLAGVRLFAPRPRWRSGFLKTSNLLAIVDRIVVIAVIAVGMTMVILTGGIDLSVGSLIALSAVVGATVMKRLGGLDAPAWTVAAGFAAGVLVCGAVGAAGGWIVARFQVPSFITTLGLMMMARGLAFMITGGFSIYQVPRAMSWLGQGRTLGVPNTVLLLAALYAAAHAFMAHTRLGRYIYAVGGNKQAARLSGVPVGGVTVFVFAVSGLAAGLGGCIQASQLNTGTPNMGVMFELYVIAAVVVGGASLAGGSGRVLGTLIGAFVISVIQNGMNLLGVESYTQQVVLGAVILGAVLLDKIRSGRTAGVAA